MYTHYIIIIYCSIVCVVKLYVYMYMHIYAYIYIYIYIYTYVCVHVHNYTKRRHNDQLMYRASPDLSTPFVHSCDASARMLDRPHHLSLSHSLSLTLSLPLSLSLYICI